MGGLGGAGGLKGMWCSAGCDKCFEVSGCWAVFSFGDKHQCFEFGVGSYRKPGERAEN